MAMIVQQRKIFIPFPVHYGTASQHHIPGTCNKSYLFRVCKEGKRFDKEIHKNNVELIKLHRTAYEKLLKLTPRAAQPQIGN